MNSAKSRAATKKLNTRHMFEKLTEGETKTGG